MIGILIILFFALLFETDIAGAEGYIFLIIVAAIMLGIASDWIGTILGGILLFALTFLAIAIPIFCIGWVVCWGYERYFEKKRFY